MKFTSRRSPIRQDYCQFLLCTQINYTLTHFAEHSENFTHDSLNRQLRNDKVKPRMAWELSKENIIEDDEGSVLFDDTVTDKNHSFKIELVRRQWSGNEKRVIKGIGIVTCIYVNPRQNKFWFIDYRIFDPDGDGKSKIDHVLDMYTNIVYQKKLKFKTVLMDAWYAVKELMLFIEKTDKIYYCPIKSNRLTDDSGGIEKYKNTKDLIWNEEEIKNGKLIKIKGFPKEHKVKLFRVESSDRRTDYVVTNDKTQSDSQAVKEICGFRWKIEQFHREIKQVTGIEKCQCRKSRIVRNHIGCSIQVWIFLKKVAEKTGRTVYNLKKGLLDDYLREQLINPDIKMDFA